MKVKLRIRNSKNSRLWDRNIDIEMASIPLSGDSILGGRHEIFTVNKVIHITSIPLYWANGHIHEDRDLNGFAAIILATKICEERAGMHLEEVVLSAVENRKVDIEEYRKLKAEEDHEFVAHSENSTR
jgi:hypothetical protein